jgi:hypothetical protein
MFPLKFKGVWVTVPVTEKFEWPSPERFDPVSKPTKRIEFV